MQLDNKKSINKSFFFFKKKAKDLHISKVTNDQ